MIPLQAPFWHHDAHLKDDDTLRREAQVFLQSSRTLPVMAQLLDILRLHEPPWWTPAHARSWWDASTRMRWLEQRPDLRQQITTQLTELPPAVARSKTGAYQTVLLDSALASGRVDVRTFDRAFATEDMVVYGNPGEFWHKLRRRLPHERGAPGRRAVLTGLLKATMGSWQGVPSLIRCDDIRDVVGAPLWKAALARLSASEQQVSELMAVEEGAQSYAGLCEIIAPNLSPWEVTCVLDLAENTLGFRQPQSWGDDITWPATPLPLGAVAPVCPV